MTWIDQNKVNQTADRISIGFNWPELMFFRSFISPRWHKEFLFFSQDSQLHAKDLSDAVDYLIDPDRWNTKYVYDIERRQWYQRHMKWVDDDAIPKQFRAIALLY